MNRHSNIISFDGPDTSTGFVNAGGRRGVTEMSFKDFRKMFVDTLSQSSGISILVHGAMFENNKIWIDFSKQVEMSYDETPEVFNIGMSASLVLELPTDGIDPVPYDVFSEAVEYFGLSETADNLLTKWWDNTGMGKMFDITERISEEWDDDEYSDEKFDELQNMIDHDLCRQYVIFYKKCLCVLRWGLKKFGTKNYNID